VTIALNTMATMVSTGLVRGLGIATFLVSRRFLGPELTGVWNLVQTVTGYVMSANSGVLAGAEREVPYWRGRGDPSLEDRSRRQMFSFSLVEASAVAAAVLLGALWAGHRYRPDLASGLLWIPVYVVLWRVSECYLVSLRSLQMFVPLARVQSVLAALDLVLIAALTYLWRLNGQYVAFAPPRGVHARLGDGPDDPEVPGLGGVPSGGHQPALAGADHGGRPDRGQDARLEGAGLLFPGRFGGPRGRRRGERGPTEHTPAAEVPAAFSTVIFPRLMFDFGSHENARQLGVDVYRYMKACVYFLIPAVIASVYFGLPFLMRWILADFRPALPVVRWLILGGVFLSLTHFPGQVLSARRKTSWNAFLMFLGCLLTAAAAWFGSRHGLQAVAALVTAAYAVFLGGYALFVLKETLGTRDALKACAVLLGALFYIAAALGAIDRLLPPLEARGPVADLGRTLGAVALSWAAFSVLFWKAERDLELTKRLKDVWRRATGRS
jgi:O-antigen/teichoic acid export membrane protein